MILRIINLTFLVLNYLLRDPKIIRFVLQNYKSEIHKTAIIRYENRKTIELGKNVAIGAFSIIIVENNKSPDSYLESHLKVGEGTYIGCRK